MIKQSENLFFVIKLLGACYLLFLAYKIYEADATIVVSTKSIVLKSERKIFVNGFWMNVLNPKVTVFFLAFLPQFLFSSKIPTVLQFYILGSIFIVVSFIIFSLIAIAAATIAEKVKQNNVIGMYLKWLQIVVFVAIAMFIFF